MIVDLRPAARRRLLPGLALLPLLAALGGCGLSTPLSADDREVLASCKADVDRTYAAQNRYQLSERDQSSSPNAENTLPSTPGAGLSDRYEQDQRLDQCIARNGPALPPAPR